MQCRNALTRIDAMRTGELPASEEHAVHDHLRTCASCDESVSDVTDLARAAKALRVETPRSCRSQFSDRLDMLAMDGRRVWVAFSERGLTMIHAGGSEEEFRDRYCEHAGRDLTRAELPARLREQVVGALEGRGVSKPKVDLGSLTEFERNVLEILTRIPRGEVRTYAWVARQAGRPSAVRAVGNICAKNVVPFVVPCHRVVPTSGGVGNYAFGSPVKRALLEREGVPIDELDRLARQGVRYLASRTTKIFCVPTCKDARRIQEKNRVPLHDESEASRKGFRPCKRCQPIAA